MSLLSKIKSKASSTAVEQEERLGGGGFHRAAGVYDMDIQLAYLTSAASGAVAVNYVLKDEKSEYRETVYISNKEGENFYYKKDANGNLTDEQVLLPGYQQLNSICLLTLDKPFDELEGEERVVRLYDFEEKKEMPKTVEHLPELIGQTIKVAISDTLENKRKKNDATNKYEPIDETREVNQIEIVAHAESGATVTELRKMNDGEDITLGAHITAWNDRYAGKQQDKRTIKDGNGGSAGKSGKPTPSASGEKKTSSLFKK